MGLKDLATYRQALKQISEHTLQDCPEFSIQRLEIWPMTATCKTNSGGPVRTFGALLNDQIHPEQNRFQMLIAEVVQILPKNYFYYLFCNISTIH